jgi:short-subunit dehydrogenase
MEQYALITGASRGIGRSIAFNLAQRGRNLLLVARTSSELRELSTLLTTQFSVKVQVLAIDLSITGAALEVVEWCKTGSFQVSILVNNAGFGLWGKFEDLPIMEQLNMLQLNMILVSELTYYMLPLLKSYGQAYILNVSSTAAYQAMPTLALYAASKSFVLSFSRALNYEVKGSGISVTCICPGPVETGFAERAGLTAIKDLAEKFNMSADVVAEIAIKAMFNKKAEVIPGITNTITAYANLFVSKSFVEKVIGHIYKTRDQTPA